MSLDPVLLDLSRQVGERLLAARLRLVTAESCTGGWLSKVITDVPDSSKWFECGYVVYSNRAKVQDLGVSEATLDRHGAVSEATVREMAQGALRVAGGDVAIAVSGVAGPAGGTPEKPVGTVWLCVGLRQASAEPLLTARVEHFPGDRESVRYFSVRKALRLILGL